MFCPGDKNVSRQGGEKAAGGSTITRSHLNVWKQKRISIKLNFMSGPRFDSGVAYLLVFGHAG